MTADNIPALCPAVDKIIHLRDGTIETGHCKALAFHIKYQIFTHYRRAYQADICLR